MNCQWGLLLFWGFGVNIFAISLPFLHPEPFHTPHPTLLQSHSLLLTDCQGMHICIFKYMCLCILKHNLLSIDHLTLDKQLVCSFLRRVTSPAHSLPPLFVVLWVGFKTSWAFPPSIWHVYWHHPCVQSLSLIKESSLMRNYAVLKKQKYDSVWILELSCWLLTKPGKANTCTYLCLLLNLAKTWKQLI